MKYLLLRLIPWNSGWKISYIIIERAKALINIMTKTTTDFHEVIKHLIVIFSSQIRNGKEFELGNFFPVWILSRSEFDYWQQLFDAQAFHQSTENIFHPILSSSVGIALKKWLEGRWFEPTLFQNFYQKLVKFLIEIPWPYHAQWGKAWALKRLLI